MSLFKNIFSNAEDNLQKQWVEQIKLNPSQSTIADSEGNNVATTKVFNRFNKAYNALEAVNRGVDLIVDSVASINYDVKDKLDMDALCSVPMRKKRLTSLLNNRPNPYQDISSFRRAIIMDLLIEGNIFIYFDGAHLFHLPSEHVEILTDKKTFVKGYRYNGDNSQIYEPEEIIHIRENSIDSIYRGESRLKSAQNSINILSSMLSYQENFFDNGAVPGLVLMTNDILSDRIKDRMVSNWMRKFNPRTGGRRPVVLDGGLKIDTVNAGSFKELDFSTSIQDSEGRILKALGVPPILLDSGNNANITPNVRLFYLTTIIPILDKIQAGFEGFFGYDLKADLSTVIALRPELKDESAYYTALVNNGIMLGSEARDRLRLDPIDDPSLDTIRIPANVAGSATGVSGQEGGAPTTDSKG